MEVLVNSNLVIIKKGDNALIYDSKSGESLKVNKDSLKILYALEEVKDLDLLLTKYSKPNIDKIINTFIKKGFIIVQTNDNKSIAQRSEVEFQEGALVHDLRLNVTESCNLNCIYCYEKVSNQYIKRRMMSWEVAKKAIDNFASIIKKNNTKECSIRFFGGEPLLNWNLIKKCLEYAELVFPPLIKLTYLINTNGTIITEEMCYYLNKYNVTVLLSLDGVDEYNDKNRMFVDNTGSFKIIDHNIDKLFKANCILCFAVVCTNNNSPYLRKLIDYAYEKKKDTGSNIYISLSNVHICSRDGIIDMSIEERVSFIIDAIRYGKSLGILTTAGNSHLTFNHLFKTSANRHCGGIGQELNIDPEGYISSCTGVDSKLGHVDDIQSILKSEEYKKLIRRTKGNVTECHGCSIEAYCAGGCYAEYQRSDNDNIFEFRECELEKLMFTELVKELIL